MKIDISRRYMGHLVRGEDVRNQLRAKHKAICVWKDMESREIDLDYIRVEEDGTLTFGIETDMWAASGEAEVLLEQIRDLRSKKEDHSHLDTRRAKLLRHVKEEGEKYKTAKKAILAEYDDMIKESLIQVEA